MLQNTLAPHFLHSYSFCHFFFLVFFFFNDTATTEIYTLSLHDALPIFMGHLSRASRPWSPRPPPSRSEEHTSELQSQFHLVCRLLLEKKKKKLQQISTQQKKKKKHTKKKKIKKK